MTPDQIRQLVITTLGNKTGEAAADALAAAGLLPIEQESQMNLDHQTWETDVHLVQDWKQQTRFLCAWTDSQPSTS